MDAIPETNPTPNAGMDDSWAGYEPSPEEEDADESEEPTDDKSDEKETTDKQANAANDEENERGNSEFKRFGLLDWSHLVTIVDSAQQQEWLIDQFIYRKGIVFLCGEWGQGKSPFVLQMLLCLAAGIHFLNHPTTGRPLKVLYVDFENPSFVVKETLERLVAFLGLPTIPLTFRIWSPNYSPRGERSGPGTYAQQLEAILRECGSFDVIVIDPLRSFDNKAEADNESAMAMITIFRRWATRTGVVPMIIHHPKKGTTNGQGSSYSLEDDPTNWMERASGAGALVSNTDVRIGFDKTDHKDELVIRVFLKGQGWQPCQYLARERDEEGNGLGYRLKITLDRLSSDKQEALKELFQLFTTGDLKQIRKRQRAGFSDGAIGELLGEYQALGLISRIKKGHWKKEEPI
jgi:AAA domain